MTLNLLSAAALIFSLGLLAQILANFIRLPAILTLLPMGLFVGPVMGWLEPDAVFGDQLLPFVSFAVAIILFEGGLTLHFKELKHVGNTVRNLVTVGTVVAWSAGTYAAYWVMGVDLRLAFLLGAILVVTGPTVIGPLLRQTRLNKRLAATLKWEGILNDPVGAILAVLVYEAVIAPDTAVTSISLAVAKAAFIGGGIGFAAAFAVIWLFRYRIIPEFLHTFATLTLVIGSYALANYFQHESGLLTVTLMGIVLANQKQVDVKLITRFKEHLTVILVSSLFILLAARVEIETLLGTDYQTILFIVLLILVVRPLTVLASAWRSEMNWKELLFTAFMAPRGIVAAAVSSIFALKLGQAGVPQSEKLISIIFSVVLVTGIFYSIVARVLSRYLDLGADNPQGLLIIGAHKLAREIASVLQKHGIYVLLIDTNRKNFLKAKLNNLECFYGNVLSEDLVPDDNLMQIGQVLAMTPNDEANSLAVLKYAETFERGNLYQLPPGDDGLAKQDLPLHLRGKYAFGAKENYEELMEFVKLGATVKATTITDEYSFADVVDQVGGKIIPLFFISDQGELNVFSPGESTAPLAGDTIISLQIDPELQ